MTISIATSTASSEKFYREMVDRNIGVYTWEEQEKVKAAKVAICGLGGVGGYEAILCARMGIGSVTGIDFDTFEISNINRQMLATVSLIGRLKATVLEEVLRNISPAMQINTQQTRIDPSNAAKLLAGHDVVLEAVDDMPTRVIIHRAARELGIPSVGMSGSPPTHGFVSTFLPSGTTYEQALNIPCNGEPLDDPKVQKRITDIKKKRAWYSVTLGGTIHLG